MGELKLRNLSARRWASPLACDRVCEELASAPGALERLRLRRHVGSCPGCGTFQEEVRRQRGLLAVALPVIPSLGFKASTLAAVGVTAGGGGAAGGGLAALIGGKVSAKLAAVALVAGGAAAGGGVAIVDAPDGGRGQSQHSPTHLTERGPTQGTVQGGGPGSAPPAGAPDSSRFDEHSRRQARERRRRRGERREHRRALRERGEREAIARGHTERGREWAKTRGKGKKRGLYKPPALTAPKRERSTVPKAPKEVRPPK